MISGKGCLKIAWRATGELKDKYEEPIPGRGAMDFKAAFSKIEKYKSGEVMSPVAAQLHVMIAKNGLDVFIDNDVLRGEIDSLSISRTAKAQLVLIFSCSTLSDYVRNSKSDLNMVDVNNAIHSVVSSTGLSYKCVIELVADVFYACGLDFSVEYGPQLIDDSTEYGLHAVMPSKLAEDEVNKARALRQKYESQYGEGFDKKDASDAGEAARKAVEAMRKLCNAGVPEGFYMLGLCYLYGECGTASDLNKGLKFMQLAAEQGIVEAAAILGDYYYDSEDPLTRDYTLAHYYYTRPGAMAMGRERQLALQDIYKQHNANKLTFVFSGVVLALMIIFLTYFHAGVFSGSSRLVLGIILVAISAALLALVALFYRAKRFNGIRWLVAAQYFVWALYAFLLVLA